MNVILDYMYRDYDNWKMPGAVVFANPDGLALGDATARLRRACCEENNFNARQVGVPEVYYENTDVESEQIYHEFCGLELTPKPTTDRRTLLQFINDFEASSRAGWINQPSLDSLGYALPVGRKTLDGKPIGVAPKTERCTMSLSQAPKRSRGVSTFRSKATQKRRPKRRRA